MIRLSIFLLIIIVFPGCNSKPKQTSRVDLLPYYEEATFTPKWFDSDLDVPSGFHQIPSFTLKNQQGETITEKDVYGKIFVVNFFFTTCPGICPKMTSNMAIVQDEFVDDPDVLLLSHSVTPEFDSVAILREYANMKEVIDDKWHLLTGKREHIYDLGRNHYFVEEDLGLKKDPNDFIHTENFVLIDQNRHIRGIYNGLSKTAVQQLITDLKSLQ